MVKFGWFPSNQMNSFHFLSLKRVVVFSESKGLRDLLRRFEDLRENQRNDKRDRAEYRVIVLLNNNLE